MRRFSILLAVLAVVLPGAVALRGQPVAVAQEATPVAVEAALTATLQDAAGQALGVAILASGADGAVTVGVVAVGLAAGEHGIHVHETGACDPAGEKAFASAGGHYNPTGAEHGQHAGDLGNITADQDGTAAFRAATDRFGLDELVDEDGAAIVIHAEEDENDPEGTSFGARFACGVLVAAPAG